MSELLPVVVLISGSGSNLQVIIDDAETDVLPVDIRAVMSNRADAHGLKRAENAGIPTHVVDHRDFGDNRGFCLALRESIDRYEPGLVVLAGFMRILHPEFVAHFESRLINLHPSLLPRYPGLHSHRRVLEHGDRWHGASVHYVTEELDAGPVIIQGKVAVEPGDTAESLQQKVHAVEYRILPKAIDWIARGRLTVEGGRVLLDGQTHAEQGLLPEYELHDQATRVGS